MSQTNSTIFAAFEICSLILKIRLPKIRADFGAQIRHEIDIGADSYKD